MKAEILKKPCVKFEARRLNTLRENRICKKVNQNVNQECAVRPGQLYLNYRIFLRKTWLIKGNQACSNMVANIFPVDPPQGPWGVGLKGQISTFSEQSLDIWAAMALMRLHRSTMFQFELAWVPRENKIEFEFQCMFLTAWFSIHYRKFVEWNWIKL